MRELLMNLKNIGLFLFSPSKFIQMAINNNVHEITSISLEHDLKEKENNLVSGNFYISGEYKVSDTSTNTETFNFTLPCDINLDNKYILKNLKIDIDDFYYEVINSNILKVNIACSISARLAVAIIISESLKPRQW